MCQLTRIWSFLAVCVCVRVRQYFCCVFACDCEPRSSSEPVLMTVGMAGGHYWMTIGASAADLIRVSQSHSSWLETALCTHTHTHPLHPVPVHSSHPHQYVLTCSTACPAFSDVIQGECVSKPLVSRASLTFSSSELSALLPFRSRINQTIVHSVIFSSSVVFFKGPIFLQNSLVQYFLTIIMCLQPVNVPDMRKALPSLLFACSQGWVDQESRKKTNFQSTQCLVFQRFGLSFPLFVWLVCYPVYTSPSFPDTLFSPSVVSNYDAWTTAGSHHEKMYQTIYILF